MNEMVSALLQNSSGIAGALVDIWSGIKLIAKGISYFIYFPLTVLNVPINPALAQIIWYVVLAWFLNKLTKNWFTTIFILFVLSVIGQL